MPSLAPAGSGEAAMLIRERGHLGASREHANPNFDVINWSKSGWLLMTGGSILRLLFKTPFGPPE